jgi:hypothetical protein
MANRKHAGSVVATPYYGGVLSRRALGWTTMSKAASVGGLFQRHRACLARQGSARPYPHGLEAVLDCQRDGLGIGWPPSLPS